MDRLHDLLKFHVEPIPFLAFHDFRLDLKNKVFSEINIKFYSPKTLKLPNISRESEKRAKNSYDISYATEFISEIKNER
jgi:hypothetical protein